MDRERLPQAQFLAAGIAAPVIFTTTFIVQAAFRPGYSHVADPVSALAAPLSNARQASATHGWPLHGIDAGHLSVVERPEDVLQALRATEGAQR